MSRSQTESIREFILDRVADSPRSVAREVALAYRISRQAANRHLDVLVEAGMLDQDGYTRSREYRLRQTSLLNREIRVTPVLNPDRLWDDHIALVLADDRVPVRDLCRGAFAEVLGNVIAHAHASWVTISFATTARDIDVALADDGAGIFHRVGERLALPGPRATAELMSRHANARSTDFPASRLVLLGRNFDSFVISSAGVALVFDAAREAWELRDDDVVKGTRIAMRLRRNTLPRAIVSKLTASIGR